MSTEENNQFQTKLNNTEKRVQKLRCRLGGFSKCLGIVSIISITCYTYGLFNANVGEWVHTAVKWRGEHDGQSWVKPHHKNFRNGRNLKASWGTEESEAQLEQEYEEYAELEEDEVEGEYQDTLNEQIEFEGSDEEETYGEKRPCHGRWEDRKAPTIHRLDCSVKKAEHTFGGLMLCAIICWSLVLCLARKGLQVSRREKIAGGRPIKKRVCCLSVGILITFCLSLSMRSNFHEEFRHAMTLGTKLDQESSKKPELKFDFKAVEELTDQMQHNQILPSIASLKEDEERVGREIQEGVNLQIEFAKSMKEIEERANLSGRKLHGGRHGHRNGHHKGGKRHFGTKHRGDHQRKHGRGHHGPHNVVPCLFMFILMASYICTLRRFMRSLKCLTDLKAVQASTENMDDEEKVATLNKAAQPKNKKCKKVVNKQVANQPALVVSPSPVPEPVYNIVAPEQRVPLLEGVAPYNPPTFVAPTAFSPPQVVAPQVIEQRQTYTLEQVNALLELERQRNAIINSV